MNRVSRFFVFFSDLINRFVIYPSDGHSMALFPFCKTPAGQYNTTSAVAPPLLLVSNMIGLPSPVTELVAAVCAQLKLTCFRNSGGVQQAALQTPQLCKEVF